VAGAEEAAHRSGADDTDPHGPSGYARRCPVLACNGGASLAANLCATKRSSARERNQNMTASEITTTTRQLDPRYDPSRDRRRLTLYFGGLIVFYIAAVLAFHPAIGDEDALGKGLFVGVMAAPTVGALLARFFGPGVIQFGRPSWWILAGFLPTLVVFVFTMLAAAVGAVDVHPDKLTSVAVLLIPLSLYVSIFGLGEEIGWRGFLWPLLRRRYSFMRSTAITFVVWWFYHAPLVWLGWYGFNKGLIAFTVGLVGLVLFAGVITDRSRSVWPSTIAHGSWNAFVAAYFSTTGETQDGLFTGSKILLGEFGAIATGAMFLLGVAATWWHFRQPQNRLPLA
jgi:membrane protease YdiL (CAAX protease family)